jgi:O-antigen ligase
MIKWLVGTGLILTPYMILPQGDNRSPRMVCAALIALSLSLYALYSKGLKPFKNKWLLLFIAFLPVSCYFSFPLDARAGGVVFGNYCMLQACLLYGIFGLMVIAVSNLDFTQNDMSFILNTAFWCGFVMACYVLLQAAGLEQIFIPIAGEGYFFGRLGGTLGNPCIASAFIAMLIPIALYLRRYWQAVLMALAVCLTWRHVSIVSMILSLSFYFALRSRRGMIIVILLAVLSIGGIGYGYYANNKAKAIINEVKADSGRIAAWTLTIKDLKDGATIKQDENIIKIARKPFTGFGPGSFGWLHNLINGDAFEQAHNEFLEVLSDLGLIGFVLAALALLYVFRVNTHIGIDRQRRAILSAFLCSCLIAFGFFIWHIGSTLFYSALFFGILHKVSN